MKILKVGLLRPLSGISMNKLNIRKIALTVFDIESESIKSLGNNLNQDFEKSVETIYKSKGKLIISGMGKSGLIGTKIAATFASTGTPSFFLHPAEAYHGDLGMIEPDDILLLISNSGETDEMLKLIPFLQEQRNTIISMTRNPQSTLAKNTTFHLNISVQKEACPLQLAPTSSTTATLVMGDALAVSIMKLRNFKDKDFAKFHPGGSLGRKLLTTVKQVMRTKSLPICQESSSIQEIITQISIGKLGLVVILDQSKIKGIITDGDLRRAMKIYQENFFEIKAIDIMSLSPLTVNQNQRLLEASEKMSNQKVNSLLVVDDLDVFVGVIQVYDVGT